MTDPRPLPSAAAAHPPADKPAEAAPLRLREDLIHPDPLLDCLVEICRLNGQAASRASLSAGLPLGDSGKGRLTIQLTERAAARAGMATKLQRLALPRIDAAALPAILIL
jgi:ATP-binding cassette subfamily C protein LapB